MNIKANPSPNGEGFVIAKFRNEILHIDSGDHVGSPLRWTHGSSANYKYMSSITDIVGQGSRKTPTQCVLWERGGAGAQSEGFLQENRANAPCADDVRDYRQKGFSSRQSGFGRPHRVAPTKSAAIGRRVFPLGIVAHWMKRHVSGRPRRVAPTFLKGKSFVSSTVLSFSKKAMPFWNLAVHSTAYNALLTRNSACKFRLKAKPCS